MSNATRRVLELFLHAPKRGVTGVTDSLGAPKSSMVTPVTPVTPQIQNSRSECVTVVTDWPVQAVESRIIDWLNRNPAPSPAGRCVWCGHCENPNSVVLPFGTGPHTWLHSECWPSWQVERQAKAAEALASMGVAPEGTP